MVSRETCMGTRKSLSMSSVNSGATLRKTTTVPSVLCFIANIELTSIAVKSSGTVQPQRSASRREPICTERQLAQIVATVKTICTITSVIGSGSAMIAILLKTDMPADESR